MINLQLIAKLTMDKMRLTEILKINRLTALIYFYFHLNPDNYPCYSYLFEQSSTQLSYYSI